jgi:amidase
LRFGYYTSDGFIKASPANRRAVLETVAALEQQGHECVEFEIPQPTRAMELFVALTSADGYKKLTSHLGPDPQEKSLFLVTVGPKLPGFVRSIACWIMDNVMGDSMFTTLVRASKYSSVREFNNYAEQKKIYDKLFYEEVWDKMQFDGIIAPVQALPTLPHGGCATLSPLAMATILYNIVDSSVGTVPVTRVDASKDELSEGWFKGPGRGSKLFEREVFEGKSPVYDPKKMANMPIGVQIVGKRWEDEKVIGMMHVVDQALGPRGFGPGKSQQTKV